jgi:prepilin-type N-terminal cleavage/methylation domain-containing protein
MIADKKGLTLVELIIAMSLLAVIITMGFSVYITGVKAFNQNASTVDNQSNVRYAMSYITRQLRKAADVQVNGTCLIIDGVDEYHLTRNTLMKNDNQLVTGISLFTITKNDDILQITITSIKNNAAHQFSLTSSLTLRE